MLSNGFALPIVFCFVYVQLVSCFLRRTFNKDSHTYAIPAGLIASTAFMAFPNNTIALYFMWKTLQVSLHIRTYVYAHAYTHGSLYISFFFILIATLFQLLWNDAVEKKKVPEVKWFVIFLYCLSTSILFHAAIVEPQNLRSSYWRFLYNVSGGR